VDEAQFAQLRASGQVREETLVWREGMANWQPCRDVEPSLLPPPPLPPPPPAPGIPPAPNEAICAECNKAFAKEEMIHYGNNWVCANCKPVFMQKLAEGARLNTGELRYAGFWIRFVAKFIDGLLIGVVVMIPLFLFIFGFAFSHTPSSSSSSLHFGIDNSLHAGAAMPNLIGQLFGFFFQMLLIGANAVYAGFFVGKYGATPGKMACKLTVVDTSGNKVTYGRAFGRGFAEILSRMICNIGYIIAAFDRPQKRALHDHICGTRVVFKE
jgi:uncharacterized RDD family membrane protein YckC